MAKVVRDLRNRDKNVQTDSIESFLVRMANEKSGLCKEN